MQVHFSYQKNIMLISAKKEVLGQCLKMSGKFVTENG